MNFSQALKKLGRSRPVQATASFLIYAYIRLVAATTRWTFVDRAHADALLAQDGGFILAFWHNRLLMAGVLRKLTRKRVFMLSSNHPDAEIIVNAARRLGVEFIRGSAANPRKKDKAKGGGGALVQMIGALKAGHIVCVTPDGPRGPRHVAHVGMIKLAQFSGAPILPGAYSVTKGRFLQTWDRLLLPLPFGAGWFVAGAPVAAPEAGAGNDEVERLRHAVGIALTSVAHKADELAGRSFDDEEE